MLITWTAAGRDAPPAPYADVIKSLTSDGEAALFRRQAVDELFTFEEAEAWVAYLQMHYDDESPEVMEEPIPLPDNALALSDKPVGEGVDQIIPVRRGDYPFAFPVFGCYDLRVHSAWSENLYRFGEDPTLARSRT
jgi:hypothetical protein